MPKFNVLLYKNGTAGYEAEVQVEAENTEEAEWKAADLAEKGEVEWTMTYVEEDRDFYVDKVRPVREAS